MNKKANIQKLKQYGFKKDKDIFKYSTDIMNGDFTLNIQVINENEIQTKLIEKAFDEPYTLHLVEDVQGTFVGQIREEYDKILKDIKEKCFEMQVFEWDYSYKVLDYAKNKYNSEAEYLWEKFPRNAVCRRNDNQKWFFAILSVKGSKIGLNTDEIVELIDLRATAEEVEKLTATQNYYPAYHMNKRHWFTIVLDGSVKIEKIYEYIDKSYDLAKK